MGFFFELVGKTGRCQGESGCGFFLELVGTGKGENKQKGKGWISNIE